jgi:S1-C subfamily serine protease
MTRKLIIAALLAAGTLNGAIKKAPESKPATPPATPPAAPPAAKPPVADSADELLDELKKRAQKNGGKLQIEQKELMELLRSVLEKQGVPAERLRKAGFTELMRLMQEKNPDVLRGLGFGAPPSFGKEIEKKLTDHFNELLEGHRPGTVGAAPATFSLRDRKKPSDPLAFATGVRKDGWLLTKATEVSSAGDLQCEINGEWVAAKVVRTWPDHDLALLKTAAKEIPVVQWSGREALEVGTFITAVAPAGRDPVAIGLVSVPVRNEQTKGRGFLGVSLTSDEHGLKIREIVPGGPAKASGLQKEDRILEMDGKKPDSVFTFTKMVSDRKAGDKVRLKLQRGEAVMEKEIALGDRGTIPGAGKSGLDRMNNMGSTISKRRTDFASVMQTDLPLQATQCGGPVTDLDGDVVGLVIARSGRVDTMVLPSETIRQVLASVDFSKEEKPAAPKSEAPKSEAAKPEAAKPAVPKPAAPKPAEPAAAK